MLVAAPITSCVGEVVKLTASISAVRGLVCCVHATTAVVPISPSDGTTMFALKSVETFVQVVSAPAAGAPATSAASVAVTTAMRARTFTFASIVDLRATRRPS